MVRSNPTHKSIRNQLRGRERDEATYSERMVKRFEKTGKLATSSTQKGVAEYEWSRLSPEEQRAILKREEMRGQRDGTGPLAPTPAELRLVWQQRESWMPATYVYECADCGKETTYYRKAGASAPRCGACKTAARRASKRKTWHKNKEKYVANKNNKKLAVVDSLEDAMIEVTDYTEPEETVEEVVLPPPARVDRMVATPRNRRVVWTSR